MKRTSILLIFIVSITVFSPAFGNKPNNQALLESQKNCSYSIEIQTTCAPSADTTDHVSVRFSDSLGNLITVKHLKNPKLLYAPKGGLKKQGGAYSGFERCAIDMFEASGPCMSQRVPGWVKVLHTQDGGHVVPVSYMFYFRTFVPENVWYGFDYCHPNGAFMPHAADFSRKD
ncbi:embryo-specific protein ats3b [Quercus suber]|uniref:Embryo-specific protein ats3b n=1 Tax=Quercus suber TaxID=58331 RepID=A0AAW0J6I6_QUESU